MVRNRAQKKVFILITAIIVVSDLALFGGNYYSMSAARDQALKDKAEEFQSKFKISMDLQQHTLSLLADSYANNPTIREAIIQGAQARIDEGGNKGGVETDRYRQLVYKEIEPSWRVAREVHHARQLQIHVGPGDISFLRIHKPERYGDDLSELRHMTREALAHGKPTSGFEMGRIVHGIRGVVPIQEEVNGEMLTLAVLECEMQFVNVINAVAEAKGGDLAVLIYSEKLEELMWPETYVQSVRDNRHLHGYFIESTTDPLVNTLINNEKVRSAIQGNQPEMIKMGEKYYGVSSFNLRDWWGTQNPEIKEVGKILLWWDMTAIQEDFKAALWRAVLIALIGLILVEVVIYFVVKYSFKGLQRLIELRTQEREAARDEADEIRRELIHMAHRSGMAEVADNVLHNIGNALNSVKIDASVMRQKLLKKEEIEFLKDMADLLESQEDFKTFVEQDPKALQIPELLSRVSSGLSSRNTELIHTQQKFDMKVEHICEIMKEQKNYAGSMVLVEEVSLKQLVEECIRLSGEALKLLKITYDVSEDRKWPVQRHRLMQVLINLMVNAVEACEGHDISPELRITVGFQDDEARISVADNGPGIPMEFAELVFQSGFSSKNNGQGIGLHFSAIAIQSMGGQIRLEHLDPGVAFHIVLPRQQGGDSRLRKTDDDSGLHYQI